MVYIIFNKITFFYLEFSYKFFKIFFYVYLICKDFFLLFRIYGNIKMDKLHDKVVLSMECCL